MRMEVVVGEEIQNYPPRPEVVTAVAQGLFAPGHAADVTTRYR